MNVYRLRRMPTACSLALVCGSLLVALPAAARDTGVAAHSDLRLCGAEAKTSDQQELALYERNGELRVLLVPAAELADEIAGVTTKSGSGCAKATAAGLAVEFPGQPANMLTGPVSFFSGGQTFGVTDPVLCQSYSPSGLTLQIGTPGGGVQTVGGWESVSYDLASRRLRPVPKNGLRGPGVQCHAFAYETLKVNPPSYGAPGVSDAIFRGRFENKGDLLVETIDIDSGNRIGLLNVTEGQPASYQLRVSNIGEAKVSGVVVREFVPTVSPAPVVDGGSWTCASQGGPACPVASGSGPIDLAGLSLGRNQSYTFTIIRTMPGGLENDRAVVAAAAFVDTNHASDGGEEDFADNAVPLVLNVVGNQPPVVSCSLPSVTMDEDDADAPFAVSCSATDADADAIDTLVVTTSTGGTDFTPLAPIAPVRDGTTDTWNFSLQPLVDQHGSVTLHAIATDALGAPSAAFALPVTVNEVNDAPTFSALHMAINVAADGSDPDQIFAFPPSCSGGNCEVILADQFFGFDAGAADEGGQSVRPYDLLFSRIRAATCGVDGTGDPATDFFAGYPMFDPTAYVAVADDPSFSIMFQYKQTATGTVYCDFQFEDDGGAVSDPVRVTFTMQPAAP